MNWKLIVVGGLVFYIATFVVSFATGPLIHEGVLDADYQANSGYWRPELTQDPPDMAALMPMWIVNGILSALVFATLYGFVRKAFDGAGWLKGLKFGLLLAVCSSMFCLGWFGIFNLPGKIWAWWAFEGFAYYPVGGVLLGWVGQKLAPEG